MHILRNVSRETAAAVLMGGAGLYDFEEQDFRKAHASAAASRQRQAAG